MAGMFSNELLEEVDKGEFNLVEYYIFSTKTNVTSDIFVNEAFAFLSTKCHLGKYIWHCDSFNLKSYSETPLLPSHLYGRTHYGDCLEDEEYIVYLLLELSKRYEDIFVRILDDKQELILILAAHEAKWLESEFSENRVFIHKGEIHFVTDRADENMSVRDALDYVNSSPSKTLASRKVQQDILMKVEGFPEKISEMKHHANCYIPANLAVLLDMIPSLISPIFCAFMERDTLDLKNCVTFRHFQPGTRVMRRVLMTRHQYAPLMQHKFTPDSRSGYVLPGANSPKFKSHDLGAKLAHGAEILCRTSSSKFQSSSTLSTDARWSTFHKALVAGGFFKDELEGSKLYNELLATAKAFFMTSIAPHLNDEKTDGTNEDGTKHSERNLDAPVERNRAGDVMLSLLRDARVDIESLRKEAENLGDSDDDGWMDISLDELKNIYDKCSRKYQKSGDDVELIPEKLKSFVHQKSSYLGVEVPESGESEIFFEPDTFMEAFQKVFDFEDPKSSSSDSELDEYDSQSDSDEGGMTLPDKEFEDLSMKDIMDLMDEELEGTKVGKSFVSHPEKVSSNNNSTSRYKTSWATWENSKKTLKPEDQSRSSASESKTGDKSNGRVQADNEGDDELDSDDDCDFKPVDVKMNLVQNLLESYSAQQGVAGPSSVVLNSLGLKLPRPDSDDDDDDDGTDA